MCLGYFLYAYLVRQNSITELRLQIPSLCKEVEQIEEENTRLQFIIDTFENPVHLIELSRTPEYRHLKHPLNKDIVTIRESAR